MKFLCLLLVFNLNCYAQSTLTGVVLDAISKNPIPNANVFITNTSLGLSTNEQGSFLLTNIPHGQNDIVISCVGYKTITKSINSKDLPATWSVLLEIKTAKNEAVTVRSPIKDGWEKYGNAFLQSYLGTSSNSKDCKLKNPKAVKFFFDKKTNQLEVVADELLIIENKKLGYILKHQLEFFLIDYKNNATYNLGYPYFVEMDTKNKRKQNKFSKERKRAYDGSLMHLIRSIYTDSAHLQGFEIRDIKRIYNLERQRVEALVKTTLRNQLTQTPRVIRYSTSGLADSATFGDSAAYYNKILAEKPYYDVLGKLYMAKDLIIKDSAIDEELYLTFPNELHVQFKSEAQEQAYVISRGFGKRDMFQTSRVMFAADSNRKIYISKNGNYVDALSIILDGYIGWEKMADMLPLDYEP